MEWWRKPVRMMRLDYLDALNRMMESDMDKLARWKKEEWNINCEWVIGTPGTASGLGYLTTFNTPKFEKYPALGDFDLIREYLPYARKHGIRVLAYLNMHWYSYDFGKKHADWEQRVEDGRSYGSVHPLYGSGTTFCVNSGWRNWAFELIEEAMKTGIDGVFLDGPVVFPECCYCASCREKFSIEYGGEVPSWEDWSNPLWRKFIEFREESMVDFLRDARQAVKRVNEEGVIFLNGGAWWPGSWRVARNIEKLSEYEDFNGAEAFFHPGSQNMPLIFWTLEAKHLVAKGKPAVVFSHHALGSWHYVPLPRFEAEISVAQTVSCGANPWFAVFDYALDTRLEDALTPMRSILGFLSRNEEYYTDSVSKAEVALLLSTQTSTFYLSELRELYLDPGTGVERDLRIEEGTGQRKTDLKARKAICDEIYTNSILGAATILSRSHIPYDVILDDALAKGELEKYSLIVLPNSACLSDEQIRSIRGFIEKGGSLLCSFETGCYNEYGDHRLENPLWSILGVERCDGMMLPRVGEEYMKLADSKEKIFSMPAGALIPRPVYSLKTFSKQDAATLCFFMNPIGAYYSAPRGVSNYAAIICRRHGESRTIYFSSLVEDFYTRYRIPDILQVYADCIRFATRKPPVVEVEAPETVMFEVREQRSTGRILVHLVNTTGNMQRPISSITRVHNIKVRIRGSRPRKAFKLSDRSMLPGRELPDCFEFTLDSLMIYDVIVFEP
ncbi:MAG: beta-galactosidase trimerization domain-containing protein [Thermoproteota archaeon]